MIQLRFARLEFTPDGAVSHFPDGSSWGALPHPEQAHYQHLAYEYGHEGETLAYCRCHELAHHVICEGFGSHSLVLFALAHGEQPTPMIAAAEESLAMNLHRYAMTNQNPHVDCVDWSALKRRFLDPADASGKAVRMKIKVFSHKRPLKRRQWHFRVVAGNGEIIARGEGYNNRADLMCTVRLLRSQLPTAEIVDA